MDLITVQIEELEERKEDLGVEELLLRNTIYSTMVGHDQNFRYAV